MTTRDEAHKEFLSEMERLNEAVEDPESDYIDYVLSVDKEIVYRICLAYGGPGEYIVCYVDEDGDLTSAEYEYQTASGTFKFNIYSEDLAAVEAMFGGYWS